MPPGPEPMESQQRMELAQRIAKRLIARYGKVVKAIGLYGSNERHIHLGWSIVICMEPAVPFSMRQ